jgi:hypothetical protein
MIKLRYAVLSVAAVVLAWDCFQAIGNADAATPACLAVPAAACASWTTPVAGGVDLDVYRQRAASDTQVIVWRASGTDPAEDFELVPVTATVSLYPALADAITLGMPVNIEYAPDGVRSGFCVSVVTGTSRAPAALRPCDIGSTFNPFQTFDQRTAAAADGVYSIFQNVLSGLVLNDARGGGDGSAVISYPIGAVTGTPNQLWELNG